jgi:UDP-2,4-diacetamido-2,4,6-trideoxy-beta-L-altropyranose hydrolase
MMLVAFRADASSRIGTGHVMRCLTLAAALRQAGASCTFFCRIQSGNLSETIASHGHDIRMLAPIPGAGTDAAGEAMAGTCGPPHAGWLRTSSTQDAQDTLDAMAGQYWDWLVVDHYGLDSEWEQRLRSSCRQIAVLDDLADRDHDCDLLVDPGAEPDLSARYARRVPRTAELFIGPHYAILRPEFDTARAAIASTAALAQPVRPRQLLVMFGGNDAAGHTFEALEVIAATALDRTKVDVVVSAINQDCARLAAFCAANCDFSLHVASREVARLMARADLVVASGGGATWERLYLRRPSLLKVVAENQRKPLEYMTRVGLIRLYGTRDELEKALRQALTQGVTPPPDMVRNGVPAITCALLQRLVSLQAPSPFHLRRSFGWLQDARLRKQFLMRGDAPTRRGHFQYWRRLLSDPAQHIYSILQGRRHIGNAGLRNIDQAAGQAELWLYFGESAERGVGLGKLVLQQLENVIREQLCCRTAVLHVSRLNLPAYRLYCQAGYQLSGHQDAAAAGFLPGLEVVRMEKTV